METLNKVQYELNGQGEFIIENYNSAKLFSSFFPGVAGTEGIPMWVFYVNRGQCVCSMGIQDKDHPIMEFLPANRAYQLTASQGFRTFIKLNKDGERIFYEPFQNSLVSSSHDKVQRMIIEPSRLILEEVNRTLGIKFVVEYFNIPQDSFAGIVRKLTIQNIGNTDVEIDGLDGLALIIPCGIDNGSLKFIRRLVEAFVEVSNYETKVPFFRGKVEPSDRPEVVRIKQGHFYVGFEAEGSEAKIVTTIVDPVKIFGTQSDYSYPERFLKVNPDEMFRDQVLENRLPCAMGYFKTFIAPNESYVYNSVIGHASSIEELNSIIPVIADDEYIRSKSEQDRNLIDSLTQNNFISSGVKVLDQYARVNFLDNTLRGGFPLTIKGKKTEFTLHLFSRKHGDLERDYNHYQLMPTYYSQGNGNFRDVNQNRRNDLFFNPDVRENNVFQFYKLIQLDGFNPLVIRETRFDVKDDVKLRSLLSEYFEKGDIEGLFGFLHKPFTPGEVTVYFSKNNININGSTENFIADLVNICEKIHDTDYGEGFWTDHWTYNLDLLENYLAVYPENLNHIVFDNMDFSFYDNPYRVRPRDEKYVIWEGKPMQLGSVAFDEEKEKLIKNRKSNRNKVHTGYGKGQVYKTNLFSVLLCLTANKISSLDPKGVGVEMETDKPNWYDALNGLPALIGSSISETIEIKRHINFLKKSLKNEDSYRKWPVFEELRLFIDQLYYLLDSDMPDFEYWDRSYSEKESYREKIKFGISGNEQNITTEYLINFFDLCIKKLDKAIEKAQANENGIISTYFINEPVEYEDIPCTESETGIKINTSGYNCFRAKKFTQTALPLFLEGPVHYLRCHKDIKKAEELAAMIRKSGLFDKKLKMYKVNAPLDDQPMEIGRARTFSPGWFENESVWLHMEYKYMLELLRSGLYDHFYNDFKNVFVPFFDPEVYGRSILENSSFIVSSNNPDPSIHGNGFVARLSGATAEFIHILHIMTVGTDPFRINSDGELELYFKPALPEWLFTKEPSKSSLYMSGELQEVEFSANTFSFMFLGKILVTYHNPKSADTFGPEGVSACSITVTDSEGKPRVFDEGFISEEMAHKVRDRKVSKIDIELG
ncbi:MAG: hypothetical protein R6V47_03195 [Candidatus Delongbacteria bacterium]